jgi:hypothetical protein
VANPCSGAGRAHRHPPPSREPLVPLTIDGYGCAQPLAWGQGPLVPLHQAGPTE